MRNADAFVALASSRTIGIWDLQARLYRGWALGRTSNSTEGVRAVRAAWNYARGRGAGILDAFAAYMLADLKAAVGATDEALALIAQGSEVSAGQESGLLLTPLHRLRGDILVARDPTLAEASYRQAIAVAREQGGRTFELFAALALARLLASTGRLLEAYEVLAPALEGVVPTPELPAIAEAQALLMELAQ